MRRFIFLFWVLITPAFADDYRFLGDYTSHTLSGGCLELKTTNRPLTLTFYDKEAVRVQMGERVRPSEAVLKPLEETAVEVVDDGERLVAKTKYARVVVSKRPLRLSFLRPDGTLVLEDDKAFGHGWDGLEVRTWKKLLADEQFFGLGEKTGPLDKRGRFWTMWNSDIPGYNNDTDPIYSSIPFFIGRHGGVSYGIFYDNPYRSTFNLGAGNDRLFSFGSTDGSLDYYVFLGSDVKKILDSYTLLTGRMAMPPKWALGYQQCRWSYYPDYEVKDLARNFRQRRIPADVLYLDIHFMDAYKVFTWDSERFPNPERLLEELKESGFKVVTIIDPGVKIEEGYSMHDEGVAGDHFLKYLDGTLFRGQVWPGWCYFPDFRKESTRAWWGSWDAKHRARGVAGFWNDMNEPALWGREMPFVVEGIKRLHNLYGYLMAQSTYEGLLAADPTLRPFVVTRASYAGIQKYAAVWTGDNSASFDDMALSVRMCLGLGLSGVPFVGPDIGGFIGRPSPELYARWIALGSMTPFMRTHSSHDTPDQEPWSLGEEIEKISRKHIERRYELMPYLYSLFHDAHGSGTPVMRPLWLEFPHDDRSYGVEDQFMLGPSLLVCPVLAEGQRFRKLYLPTGGWWDVEDGALHHGPKDLIVEAPLDKLPLFQRAGSIVCRQPVMQWVDQLPLKELRVEAVVGKGRFDLYLDDGLTVNSAVERVHFEQGDTLRISSRSGAKVREIGRLRLTWHGAPSGELLLNGRTIEADYHTESKTWECAVDFRPGDLEFSVRKR